MNKTAYSDQTQKTSLLCVIRALDTRSRALTASPSKKKGRAPKPGKETAAIRRSLATSELLRRYFVMQVAQISGNAG